MKTIARKYETTKRKANEFMKKGQITQYLDALIEMNRYKRLMTMIISN